MTNTPVSLNQWPDNIVADRHDVTGKWVLHYLTDEQAAKCREALKQREITAVDETAFWKVYEEMGDAFDCNGDIGFGLWGFVQTYEHYKTKRESEEERESKDFIKTSGKYEGILEGKLSRYEDALRAIANGADDPMDLAHIALDHPEINIAEHVNDKDVVEMPESGGNQPDNTSTLNDSIFARLSAYCAAKFPNMPELRPSEIDKIVSAYKELNKSSEIRYNEQLVDDVEEYLHWRKVNPQIKGGENYLKRFRESLTSTKRELVADWQTPATMPTVGQVLAYNGLSYYVVDCDHSIIWDDGTKGYFNGDVYIQVEKWMPIKPVIEDGEGK